MAYIHVKRIGGVNYYTLRISVRKNGKVVTKDLVNLGSDISKISIESLERKYKKEIRDSYDTIKKFLDTHYYVDKVKSLKLKKDSHFTKGQLEEIEAAKLHYNEKFLKSSKSVREQAFESFLLSFAVNSSAIEGNTITLKEAYKLFKEDILPKDKTLREVHDLNNTKRVVEFLKEKKPKLNLDLIIIIHDMLLEGIDPRKGIRNHDIKIFGQPFKPSPARYVKADMQLLLEWHKKNKEKLHPLALVIFFHHKFEKIHPFSDGNGRTGRVIMNYILEGIGYPPLVISKRFRKEYLDAMNKADAAMRKGFSNTELKHYESLLSFVQSQFVSSYWDTFLV